MAVEASVMAHMLSGARDSDGDVRHGELAAGRTAWGSCLHPFAPPPVGPVAGISRCGSGRLSPHGEDQSWRPLGDAKHPKRRTVGITDATLPRLNQLRTDVQALRKHRLGYFDLVTEFVDLDSRHRAWGLREDRGPKIPLLPLVVRQRLTGGIQHVLKETVLHCFLQFNALDRTLPRPTALHYGTG